MGVIKITDYSVLWSTKSYFKTHHCQIRGTNFSNTPLIIDISQSRDKLTKFVLCFPGKPPIGKQLSFEVTARQCSDELMACLSCLDEGHYG